MTGASPASDEESLVRRAEALVRSGGSRPLPDVPALEGALFDDLLDRLDESTVERAVRSATGEDGDASGALEPGARLGSVRIESLLGEGGMGRVYRGFDEKLGRPVAVKTIRARAGLSEAARARFRREARLLSRLNHPSICQVYDLLERPEGHYLLLELVEGETLRDWLERGPSEAERLSTAIAIAEAVAAAHRAGVIHRDLKPDNVMCLPGGSVKVLDFGIARAEAAQPGEGNQPTGPAASEALDGPTRDAGAALTGYRTELGSVIGTPAYMSPEQARGEPVEAASDLWALGVLFHEIFAGRRPLAESRPSLTQLRSPEIHIAPELGIELARLFATMLEAEPLARPTAEAVAARLRWIAGRPVRRRRRILVAAGAAIVLLGVARYIVDVRAQRAEALAARAEAEEVVSFLVSIFEVSDPSQALGETITARELLDRGSQRLAELAGRPRVQARLEATVGSVYEALGLYVEAAPHLERAVARRRELLGAGHPDTLATGVRWSELEFHRGHVAEAEASASEVVEQARRLTSGSERDALLIEALDLRGTARRWLGNLDTAETDKREALAIAERSAGADSRAWAEAAAGLAMVLRDEERPQEAEPLARRALEILERELPESHPNRAIVMNNYALVLTDLDRSEEALALLREIVALEERTLGPTHPSIGISLDNLALALFRLDRLEESEAYVRRAVEIFRGAAAGENYGLATALHNLGVIARERGRYDESIAHLEEAIALARSQMGDRSPSVAGSTRALAAVYERRGEPALAEPLLAEALAIEEEEYGHESASLVSTLCRLARSRAALGRDEAALADARRALGLAEAAWGVEDARLGPSLETLATVLEAGSRSAEAAEVRARLERLPAG